MTSKLERVLNDAVLDSLEETLDVGALMLGILGKLEVSAVRGVSLGFEVAEVDGKIFLVSVSARTPHRRGVRLAFSEELDKPHKHT